MMQLGTDVWTYTLLSVFVVSLLSLGGVLTLAMKKKNLQNILLLLVSFSAGALLADAFLHLIPEAIETTGLTPKISSLILAGIVVFFILEKFINWQHCHVPTTKKHPHPHAITNLVGDMLHNFVDGVIIAASFMVSTKLGIATTVAVALHEIPQEIGDFGVLLHGGFDKKHALFFNFMSALTAFIGALLVLIIGQATQLVTYLIPLTAGGFIYIAASDLIPQLHKEKRATKSLHELLALILGILVMYLLLFVG